MKAAAIDKTGPPEVLTIHTLPVPKVGPKDVLISLLAAGVGIWDAQIRNGDYSVGSKRFPRVLGFDGAGMVAAVGKGVSRFKAGDKVWAYVWESSNTGFYAEYVAPNEKNVAHAPSELTLIEAGAAAVTGLTALQGVDDHLKPKKPKRFWYSPRRERWVVWRCSCETHRRACRGNRIAGTRGNDVARDWIEQVFDSRAAD